MTFRVSVIHPLNILIFHPAEGTVETAPLSAVSCYVHAKNMDGTAITLPSMCSKDLFFLRLAVEYKVDAKSEGTRPDAIIYSTGMPA